jgi:hypothetical protein
MSTTLQRAEVALERAEVMFILRHQTLDSQGKVKNLPLRRAMSQFSLQQSPM